MLKRFIKTGLIFFLGNILSKLVSFALLPLYTSKIPPSQFGIYDLVMSFINMIAPISCLQIWDGMYRFSFEYSEKREKENVISNATLISLLGCVVFVVLFSALQIVCQFDYFELILINGVLYALHYLYTYAARVYLSNYLFVFSGVASTLTTTLLNVWFILKFGWDIKSLYLAASIGLGVQLLIIECKIGVMRKLFVGRMNWNLLQSMIKFSVPLCISTISYWLLSGYTKVIITNLCGEEANGLYAVASKFSSFVILAVSVLQFAWNEMAYLLAEKDERNSIYSKCVDMMVSGGIYGTIIFCLLTKLVFGYVIDSQYMEALQLVPATIIGVAASSLAGFFNTLFMTEKKTKDVLLSTLISSGTNLIIGYVATRIFGVQGAIVALGLSFILLMVIRLIKLKTLYSIEFKLKKLTAEITLLVLACVLFFWIHSECLLVGIIVIYVVLFLLSFRKEICFLKAKIVAMLQKNSTVSDNGTVSE